MDEDSPILKKKKRKVAIDPDQEDDENVVAVVTKSQGENMERENYEHKTNGDKKPEIKKQPEKKEEIKPKKEENKSAVPTKPKPVSEKEKSNTQKENEQKAKPNSVSNEKKPSTTNGQPAKKPVEEKKAAPKPAKRKEESEDDEDESEDESDSESDRPKKTKKKTPTKKEPVKKEPAKSGTKDELVYNVLKRWWYCMPEWPPANFDYSAELEKRKLRKIDFKYWRIERDVDERGYKKVYEIPSYPGVFKNAQGENVDLRPRENCPCYEVMKKKSMDELLELLAKALKNQIEALEKSGNNDEELMKDLQRELKRAEKTIAVRKK